MVSVLLFAVTLLQAVRISQWAANGCDFYWCFCRRLLSAVSITAFTARRGCLGVSCPRSIVAQKKTKAAVPAALKSRGYPPTEKNHTRGEQ